MGGVGVNVPGQVLADVEVARLQDLKTGGLHCLDAELLAEHVGKTVALFDTLHNSMRG